MLLARMLLLHVVAAGMLIKPSNLLANLRVPSCAIPPTTLSVCPGKQAGVRGSLAFCMAMLSG